MNQTANSDAAANAEPSDPAAWIDEWLQAQQAWLKQWQSAAAAPLAGIDMEMLRKQFNPASFDALNVVQSFQTLMQASLAPLGQGTATDPQTAWQAVLQSFAQPFAQSFALGPLREQQSAWQAYMQALADYEARQRVVLEQYGKVFASSLARVREQAEQRRAQGQPIQHLRELYEAWIDCGEQTFAQLAHDPAFMTSQADSANALSRLKAARNVLFEQWLRTQDLPTRSELNSVHLRLRELTARVTQLEQELRAATVNRPIK